MHAFAKLFIVLFALLAVATAGGVPSGKPTPTTTATPTPTPSQCSTGPVQCCQSVQKASSSIVQVLLKLLGVVIGDLTTEVGLTCSPLDVIGVGSGSDCNSQVVCCENNSFNGIIAIGCSPVNINL